jgi:hypothetical protein
VHLLAASLALLWMSVPDAVRHGCYSALLLIVVVAIFVTLFDWPAVVGAIIVLVLLNLRGSGRNKPPSLPR